ncbi:DNA polymerase alpha catalytic subunit-like [Temnothorax curvispinosus]|uniref:DNA polymerase alpha catalytic subunit-like n=1 Tax=Temnothorax curvispinosus TaxID=300111 RepID=A0A6J1R9V6_9HYME|nr:DNA polymerase alpha catalytic subunit-like [Temnothorax curvispinosus]
MKEHECKKITSAETPSFFNTVDKVLNLMHVTLKEAKYIMTIVMDLNVISLALQIICLAGNILSRTLLGRRAERNEYACNNRYSFNLKDYITLDKKIEKKGRGDEKKLRRMLEASYLIRRKVSMTSWDC